jgi:hypothetical protein
MNNAHIIGVHIKGENVVEVLWICLKCKIVFRQKKAGGAQELSFVQVSVH